MRTDAPHPGRQDSVKEAPKLAFELFGAERHTKEGVPVTKGVSQL